ncbi:MAG: hypothetical protein JWR80_6965 [Bradyrhizobium sp.]|nr:hypothetical protein [Bradyrhizobium sp.]
MQFIKPLFFLTSLLAIGLVLWRTTLSAEARRLVGPRFGLVILLPGVGLLVPNVWLYYALIAVAMAALPRSRVEAVGLFLLIALTLPQSGIKLELAGTYLTRIDTIRVASLALITAFRFPRGVMATRSAGRGFDILFCALFLLEWSVTLRSGDALINPTSVLRALVENVVPLAIPFFFLTRSVRKDWERRQLLTFLIMAGFLLSIVASFETVRHWPLYQSIDSHLGTGNGLSKTLALRGGMLRSPGPFAESTTFSVFLALATIATAASRSVFRSTVAHQCAIFVGVSGTFATLARNGWVGLALGLVLIGLYRGRFGRTVVLASAAAVIFGIAALATPKSGAFGALTGQSGHAAQTSDYRARLFEVSIPVFKSSPWIGTPSAQLGERLRSEVRSRKLDVDFVNSYLYFALTSGIIGLIVFSAFILMPIPWLWKFRWSETYKGVNREYATAIFACLGAFSVMVAFTSFFDRIPLFSIILFGAARNTNLRLDNKLKS